MTEYVLVDTNVLIVASAEHPGSPFSADKTPIEDPELRQDVLDWVHDLEGEQKCLLIHPVMLDEYRKKLSEQDYGHQVILNKLQTCEYIPIEIDDHGDAVIPAELEPVIHDRADRKWVAASLQATADGKKNRIINACDTDWMEWEDTLSEANIEVEQLIENWCRAKFEEKQAKKRA